jgi:hypothetical protein
MIYDAIKAAENNSGGTQEFVDGGLVGTGYQMYLVQLKAILAGDVNLLKKIIPTLADFGKKRGLGRG